MFLLFFFQFVVGEDVNADASNDNRQSMRTTQMNLTISDNEDDGQRDRMKGFFWVLHAEQ